MGCGAQMNRLRHCPCCCGGLLWMVTREFCDYGITEVLVGRLRVSGVMRHDQIQMQGWLTGWVLSIWWTRQRWWLLRGGLLPACVCGDGGRYMTANAM